MKKFALLLIALLAAQASSQTRAAVALSLHFEENRGQAPAEVKFLARGPEYALLLTSDGGRLALNHAQRKVAVGMRLVGANPAPVVRGIDRQIATANYFRGNKAVTEIPTYGRVRYEATYPGIDMVYHGDNQQLEYDFIVHPGANPNRIALGFDGTDSVNIDDEGNLVLHANGFELMQHKPVVYQERSGLRRKVEGAYRLLSNDSVGFQLGPYDHNAALVIDPILSYSQFFGGNGNDDARAVTTDPAGNVYIAGSTASTDFTTVAPFQPAASTQDPTLGLSDAFVMKLNPSGVVLYSTYFGGTGDDRANAVRVDSAGNAVIAGSTSSLDLFTVTTALRRVCSGGSNGCLDGFVAKFDSTGSNLMYSTYLGGTGDDEARALAIDNIDNIYVVGATNSPDFRTTAGAYLTDPSATGFVIKMDMLGNLAYSTYFGTVFGPADPKAAAVDSSGNLYLTGSIALVGSNTGNDVFITKMNSAGTAVIYTQTIRGSKDETGNAIAVDSSGNAYVAGQTTSMNFLTTGNAIQRTFGGGPVFHTSNSGSTWSAGGNGISRTSVYAIAVTLGNPSTVYVGADDETAGGLFRSTDGGDTWTSVASGILDTRTHALAIDPTAPTTIFAGTRTLGVYKSVNGGTGWTATPLNNVYVTALTIDPTSPSNIYAGTDANGVYKTTNGGTTWSSVSIGLGTSAIRSILIDPSANTTLYAATASGVYKSTNSGANWNVSNSGLANLDVNAIVADPSAPGVLFAGTGSGIFRSANGGASWSASNGGLPVSAGVIASALAVDPSSKTLYAGVGQPNAMRVYKTTDGSAWSPTSLATVRITGLAMGSSGNVFAGTTGGSDGFVVKWNPSGSIVYSTYLGGYRDDTANGIAVDLTGAIYVVGTTGSTNLPSISAVQSAFGGGTDAVTDAFVVKLSPSGSQFGYSTYLGGSKDDFGRSIAVDATGAAYVVGGTASLDFPTVNQGAATHSGLQDAFLVKIGDGSAITYTVPVKGGFSVTSSGAGTSITVGYAQLQQVSGGANPSGIAIFDYRQNNILVSEAAVPASSPINTGRIYVEVGNAVDTGIAIANPNSVAATLSYYFTDRNGQTFGQGSITIPANGQLSGFLDQAPFFGGNSLFGTFTFTASQPVAVIALRGRTNERGEFLMTTLPVSDLSVSADTKPILFPHFADGGGWVTQIVLVNTTDSSMTGTLQFGGQSPQNYSIAPRSATKLVTPGTDTGTLTGAVRVTPDVGNNSPTGVAVFSFKKAGVTVSEAGVPAFGSGNAFRIYSEASGTPGQIGSIQTGIALANASSNSILVNFELTSLTGATVALSSIVLPGNGQQAMFLGEIPGFSNVPLPVQGVLRVSAQDAVLSVIGLRGRYNERGDFLITTTPPTNEASPVSSSALYFPHFADGGGYTTQFILFSTGNQAAFGAMRFFDQSGQSMNLSVR